MRVDPQHLSHGSSRQPFSRSSLQNILPVPPTTFVRHASASVQLTDRISCSTDYAIIPVEEVLVNKSPLILVECRLVIESWCLPLLLKHAKDTLLRLKHETSLELQDATSVLLMLCPDFTTAWNTRSVGDAARAVSDESPHAQPAPLCLAAHHCHARTHLL